MTAVDTNVLVHAHREDSPFHSRAYQTVAELAEGKARWAIPWPCLHEFLSIVTHPKIFDPPSSLEEALDQVEAWLDSPSLVLLGEGPTYWGELKRLLLGARATGPRIHDARVAALSLLHAAHPLLTADRDFGRFPQLEVRNPLIE